MADPPATPPGHWVQCPECLRFFENEQGRGSHRLHSHGVRGTGEQWLSLRPLAPPTPHPAQVPPSPEPAPVASASGPPPVPTPSPSQELSEGQAAAVGLSAIAQTLAMTPPSPTMGKFGRGVVVVIFLLLSGVALYLVVRELKAPKQPEQPYVIDAARIQPGAPVLTTGDPYWDSVLGYRGRRL